MVKLGIHRTTLEMLSVAISGHILKGLIIWPRLDCYTLYVAVSSSGPVCIVKEEAEEEDCLLTVTTREKHAALYVPFCVRGAGKHGLACTLIYSYTLITVGTWYL